MKRRFDDDGAVPVPDELRSLHDELSSIRYEERPSFGPELQAELSREWVRLQSRRRMSFRPLVAAAVVALLAGTAGVPSARASLVRLISVLQGDEAAPVDVPAELDMTPPEPTPVVTLAPILEETEEPPESVAGPRDPFAPPRAIDRIPSPAPTYPEVEDRARVEALILRRYPVALQRAGVGGSVGLMFWVDSAGAVDFVTLQEGSGVPELDRVALQVAPSIRFVPAIKRGKGVGTWVEFDIVFRVDPDVVGPLVFPAVDPFDGPEVYEPLDLNLVPEWQGEIALLAPVQREAGELLESAIDDDRVIEELGPIESILAGEPPAGIAPMRWRSQVASVLDKAMVRDPNNPAPLLALARIRRKQGLSAEARALFERGVQRAERAAAGVSPSLFAELHYQRATLINEAWLAYRDLGRVPAEAFDGAVCATAPSTGITGSEFASADRLIAWNYLCPAALATVLDSGFEATDQRGAADLAEMMASFRAAVRAYPEHVGANVAILLALADEGRWTEVLDGARRFERASGGHPYALLLGGLALQRLARSDEAQDQFMLALRGLPESEADALQDLRFILDEQRLADYRRVTGDDRRAWEKRFWAPFDPILSTSVNERTVEHIARSAYAQLRFGSTDGDSAEVWIRYGRPTDVKAIGQSEGLRTEFWDYGAGPDFTFSRVGSSLAVDLTTEGRAYVDDLGEVLSHRYGTASRSVSALRGQVTRFYGGEPGALEIRINTEVPDYLAGDPSDTLDLGLFLMDVEGKVLPVTRGRIRAEVAPVALRAPTSPEVASLVVELFNSRTGRAAQIREAVTPIDVRPVAVSDLLIVRPTRPRPNLSRDAEWLEPLSLVSPQDTDALGVYFEVYESEGSIPWYRLRAEVVDRQTGVVTGVPIRPAGEEGFRPTWDRFPDGGGVTSEFLTVSLRDVDRSMYTLRIIVDVPEVGAGIVTQRDLDRREDENRD
jgi:TonB family protein